MCSLDRSVCEVLRYCKCDDVERGSSLLSMSTCFFFISMAIFENRMRYA